MRVRLVATLSVAFLLIACSVHVPSVIELENFRSSQQVLVLENPGEESLLIHPKVVGLEPLTIVSGASIELRFTVLTVSEIEQPANSARYRVVARSASNLIDATEPSGYLVQADLDATLRIGKVEVQPDEWRLTLGKCGELGWEARPAPSGRLSINISAPPLPGVATRICPVRWRGAGSR